MTLPRFGARPRLARSTGPVEAEKPPTKKLLDEIVQCLATTVQQARRRTLDDGSVTLTFSRENHARMMARLERLYK